MPDVTVMRKIYSDSDRKLIKAFKITGDDTYYNK